MLGATPWGEFAGSRLLSQVYGPPHYEAVGPLGPVGVVVWYEWRRCVVEWGVNLVRCFLAWLFNIVTRYERLGTSS